MFENLFFDFFIQKCPYFTTIKWSHKNYVNASEMFENIPFNDTEKVMRKLIKHKQFYCRTSTIHYTMLGANNCATNYISKKYPKLNEQRISAQKENVYCN